MKVLRSKVRKELYGCFFLRICHFCRKTYTKTTTTCDIESPPLPPQPKNMIYTKTRTKGCPSDSVRKKKVVFHFPEKM